VANHLIVIEILIHGKICVVDVTGSDKAVSVTVKCLESLTNVALTEICHLFANGVADIA
jgi:hypothetical protein